MLNELDKICNLPVTSKVISNFNYRSYLDTVRYGIRKIKPTKETAVKECNLFFSFKITEKECIIYQTESMHCEQEWIIKKGKSTKSACSKAIKEFYKRYNK